jgi:DNA-binding NarL/FixJ family response regulator
VVFDDSGLPLGSLVFLQLQSDAMRTLTSFSAGLSTSAIEHLSPRERDVLHRLYHGATNRAIALQCHISEKTVEKHRSAAMKKLNVASFSQLVRLLTLAELTYGPELCSVEHASVRDAQPE